MIDALERYKAQHGAYPETLESLLTEKFLGEIPDFADDNDFRGNSGQIKNARPLAYAREGTGYRLRVEFTFAYTHPIGLGDPTRRVDYSSAEKKWQLVWSPPPGQAPVTKKK